MGKYILAVGVLALGCSSSDGGAKAMPVGSEGEACYANGTCDSGLACFSKLCVIDSEHPDAAGGNNAGGPDSAGANSTAGASDRGGAPAAGSGGGTPPESTCVHRNVTNGTAPEKVNAAFCVGLGLDDNYSCTFNPSASETRCIGATTSYVVVYSDTDNGTLGDIYDLSNNKHIGTVVQGASGAFEIVMDTGMTGACVVNGDVATLCHN
jgi:hypothetical protein